VRNYRDLLVWQNGIELVKEAYLLSKGLPASERFGLVSQIRRAAASVPSNIAEGHARQHDSEFRQFLYVALGSLAELDTQVTVAAQLGYLRPEQTAPVNQRITELRRMISGLVRRVGRQAAP
jgi:four helix bundle protein